MRKLDKLDYLILSQLSASKPKMLEEVIEGMPRTGLHKLMEYDLMEVSEYLHSHIHGGLVTKVANENHDSIKKFLITNRGMVLLNTIAEPKDYGISGHVQYA